MKRTVWLSVLLLGVLTSGVEATTIIVNDTTFEITKTLDDATDLWVTPEDFERISGFVLKPEGACLNEMCVPLRQDRDSDLYVTRQDQGWVNVTAFAKRVQQAYAVDHDKDVWSFGLVPANRKLFLESAIAPDFALTERNGTVVHLSDFRGKKVMIITWASW